MDVLVEQVTSLAGSYLPRLVGAVAVLAAMLALTACLLSAAHAADDEAGLWVTGMASTGFADDWTATMAVQPRWLDGIDTLERVVLRPFVTRRAGAWNLSLGYDAHLIEDPRVRTEHRAWQQVATRATAGNVTLDFWLRLEERVFYHLDGTGLRARLLSSARWPMGHRALDAFIVRNEVFYNLNSLDGGPGDGFDQNRFFAGFGLNLGETLKGELGYQMQALERPGQDLIVHQTFLVLSKRF